MEPQYNESPRNWQIFFRYVGTGNKNRDDISLYANETRDEQGDYFRR